MTGKHKNGDLVGLILSVSEAETPRGTLYIALFEKAQDKRVIFDTDLEGKIVNVKGNIFLTLGYHPEELIGKNISIICPEDIGRHHAGFMDNYLRTGNGKVIGHVRNLAAKHKSSKLINISLHVNKLTNSMVKVKSSESGEVIENDFQGYRGIITPVDNVQAMVTVSKTGRVLSASEEFCLLFGYDKGDIQGKNIAALVKGDIRDIFSKKMVVSNIPKSIICVHKDNSIFTAEITVNQPSGLEDAESKLDGNSWICKIGRTGAKKQDKEIINDGEYMGLYEYGRILGSGYFGKVRMAKHRLTGERVAIKTLRKKQYLSVHMEYPPREINVLKAIDHPHINRLYDTVILSDRIHLILEYVDGRELCEIVEQKRIPEDICRHLWRQIVSAIAYLHENHIVHRDLKLENIIIDKKGSVKIIDLGFGNFILHENHLLRTFCGSPDYAAPELFLGKAYNGFHADCWSLGVLLFAMLSGSLPFGNSNDTMQGHFTFPETFPPKAKSLVSSILRVNTDERFNIKDILEHPWTNMGYSDLPPKFVSSVASIDQTILDKMVVYGMNPETVRNSLVSQQYNQFTTTYFLFKLSKQKAEEGYVSDTTSSSKESSGSGNGSDEGGKKSSKPKSVGRKGSKDDCALL